MMAIIDHPNLCYFLRAVKTLFLAKIFEPVNAFLYAHGLSKKKPVALMNTTDLIKDWDLDKH